MWKREETARPTGSATGPSRGGDAVNIGMSVVITGELIGREDLTIEGQVDGKIALREHVLTIGPNGKINAQVVAKSVVVMGVVHGKITATERITIRKNGSVEGDISAPRVAIEEGAHFRGGIDMQRSQASTDTEGSAKPVAAPAPAPAARVASPAERSTHDTGDRRHHSRLDLDRSH